MSRRIGIGIGFAVAWFLIGVWIFGLPHGGDWFVAGGGFLTIWLMVFLTLGVRDD